MPEIVFISMIENLSYLGIFIFAIFSGYIIPIPEEIILLIVGYMAYAEIIHMWPAILVVILAFVIGDNVLYRLTLRNNKWVSKLINEVFSLKIVTRNRPLLEKHVHWTIFLTRFLPFMRFVGPVFSGYVKVQQKTFMIFNSLAIIIYAPLVIWIGYHFNGYLFTILDVIGEFKHPIAIAGWVIVGLLITRYVDYLFRKYGEK